MKTEKFLGLVGIIFLFFFGIPITIREKSADDEILFKDFLLKFKKTYNDTEYKIRFKNFKASLKRIAELNENRANNESAIYGLTEYSDLSQDEFFQNKLQKPTQQFHHKHSRHRNYTKEREKRESLPLKVDWRKKGAVGMVHNQKSCGACWAFATIQTAESMNAIKTGTLVDLSVQESLLVQKLARRKLLYQKIDENVVIDCARYGNFGCEGGDSCSLLSWLISTKTKITTEKLYPFTYKTGVCKAKTVKTGIQIKSFTCEDLAGAEDQLLKDIAYHGPIAAVVNAINWQYYLGGIIQFHCSGGLNDMNHAVQIVGYDKTGSVPYYIAKNSWGPEFGDKGYVYIAIGKNLCGLANQVSSLDLV